MYNLAHGYSRKDLGVSNASDIIIPIFSKNFIESHWCLDQVAHMCKANGIFVPLYYDVKTNEKSFSLLVDAHIFNQDTKPASTAVDDMMIAGY